MQIEFYNSIDYAIKLIIGSILSAILFLISYFYAGPLFILILCACLSLMLLSAGLVSMFGSNPTIVVGEAGLLIPELNKKIISWDKITNVQLKKDNAILILHYHSHDNKQIKEAEKEISIKKIKKDHNKIVELIQLMAASEVQERSKILIRYLAG